MCEKRGRKIRKSSHLIRLRETRRLQQLQWLASSTSSDDSDSSQCSLPADDQTLHNRVLLQLAWKTVALMQKNRLIQEKIIALQKETSEFLTAIMNNPEHRRRYIENAQRIALSRTQNQSENMSPEGKVPIKIE